jgi:hypothetical protein
VVAALVGPELSNRAMTIGIAGTSATAPATAGRQEKRRRRGG